MWLCDFACWMCVTRYIAETKFDVLALMHLWGALHFSWRGLVRYGWIVEWCGCMIYFDGWRVVGGECVVGFLA